MLDLRTDTARMAASAILFGGMLDIFLAVVGGNRSTLSRVLLDDSGEKPVLCGLLAYALVMFYVHLQYPTFAPPPTFYWGLTKALVAVSPVFLMVYLLWTGKPQDDSGVIRRFFYGDGYMLLRTCVGAILGALSALFLVRQHVTPL